MRLFGSISHILCLCLSVGLVFESHSLLILGWRSSLPRASAIWTQESVPIFKLLCFPSVTVVVPPFSLSQPSKIHPGSFPYRAYCPYPLSFITFSLPSAHTQAKYHQPHRLGGGTNLHMGHWTGNQERTLFGRCSRRVVSFQRTEYEWPDATGGGRLNILIWAERREKVIKERGYGQYAL